MLSATMVIFSIQNNISRAYFSMANIYLEVHTWYSCVLDFQESWWLVYIIVLFHFYKNHGCPVVHCLVSWVSLGFCLTELSTYKPGQCAFSVRSPVQSCFTSPSLPPDHKTLTKNNGVSLGKKDPCSKITKQGSLWDSLILLNRTGVEGVHIINIYSG